MTDAPDAWRDAAFRKSSFSDGANACVEVTRAAAMFGLRDSKNSFGPVLAVAVKRGQSFLAAVKREQITRT